MTPSSDSGDRWSWRTPFQRRIFDTTRPYALTVRKPGFEAHEQMLSASDEWVKKGNVRVRDNVTDVELVVRGNRIRGNLRVSGNTGPSGKFVQGNTGWRKTQIS